MVQSGHLKNIIKSFSWVLIIGFMIVMMGFIYPIMKSEETIVVANNHETKDPITTMTYDYYISKYPGLNLRTKIERTNKYTLSINIPTINNNDINTQIHQWIDQQESAFLKKLKLNDELFVNGHIAHLNIQLKTKKLADDLYTLLLTSSQYTGGANGQTFIKPFTIDLKKSKLVKLSDVIHLNKESMDELKTLIKKEIKKDQHVNSFIDEDSLNERLDKPEELKWTVNEEALKIYFDKNEVASGAAETFNITIPIEKLEDYINRDFLEVWQEEEEENNNTRSEQETSELNPDGKYIALTFDDGPSNDVTPRILDILKQYEAKATFFMLGIQVEYYPKIAKQVAEAGHEIGNHSNGHPDFTRISYENIKYEIEETNRKIEKATGIRPKLIRPPYGAYNDLVYDLAKDNGQSIVLWSVDSLDWKNRNAIAVNNIISRDATNGAIVLMHDIHSPTADALNDMLGYLTDKGYQFVTVSELLTLQKTDGVGPYHGKN